MQALLCGIMLIVSVEPVTSLKSRAFIIELVGYSLIYLLNCRDFLFVIL